MGWDKERVMKLARPEDKRACGGRPVHRHLAEVQGVHGAVPVVVAEHRLDGGHVVQRLSVGPVPDLTWEQACRVLDLIRAVPPYPKPVGRTRPGEPVAFEVGGES